MQAQDQGKFKELIAGISETYGDKAAFTAATAKIWWAVLKPYSIEQVETAVYAHISCPDSGMFAPKPANIIKMINGDSKQKEQKIEDRAEIAWACVERQIAACGSYESLILEDRQALASVKGIGGWQSLSMCTYDQLVWKKKEFIRMYECFERTPKEDLPKILLGVFDQQNNKKLESSQADNMIEMVYQKMAEQDEPRRLN